MRTLMTTAALAALTGLSSVRPASAQDVPPVRQPTVREALEALERERDPKAEVYDPGVAIRPAVAILRRTFGPRPAAELAGLADRLAEMAADTTLPRDVRIHAMFALSSAADPESSKGGIYYPRGFDMLVRVYESGTDDALYTVFRTDPERGPAYVRNLFERSERPALCFRGERWGNPAPGDPPDCVGDPRKTPWCRAGRVLYGDIVDEANRRTWPPGVPRIITAGDPLPVPDGLPEHVEDWHRRCL